MLRNTLLMLLMLTAWQVQAAYECNSKPQDDIIITAQSVQIVGAGNSFKILPGGDVIHNNKALILSDAQRKLAFGYQAGLRTDLAWIEQGVQQHLAIARNSLDKVIVQQLGNSSNLRNRLAALNDQLKQQMSQIIEKRSDSLILHHKAIAQAERDSRLIIRQSLTGVLQDSLNEVGVKQLVSNYADNNPLQAMLGNMAELQQAIKTEWNNQQQGFSRFGYEVCNKVTHLEQQRNSLFKTLKLLPDDVHSVNE